MYGIILTVVDQIDSMSFLTYVVLTLYYCFIKNLPKPPRFTVAMCGFIYLV